MTAKGTISIGSGFCTKASITPEQTVKIPLNKSDPLANAFLPTLSCTTRMNKHAGRMVDDVTVKTTNGEYPKPFTFLEMAS